MNKMVIGITAVAASMFLVFNGCEGSGAATRPAAIPDGNCVGKITDVKGVPIGGAAVFLVPQDYQPGLWDDASVAIDSTVCNSDGYYGFNVESSGKYNLLANDNQQFAISTSIPIRSEVMNELPDGKLLDPGILTGSVTLEGMDDNRFAVVLLPGTNTFTTPSEASGEFTVGALAQGIYDLRIVCVKPGYAVVETTVVVTAGTTTALQPIQLFRKTEARVKSLSVMYDSAMMKAMLTWTAEDDVAVDSFRIYCNREENFRPVATFGREAKSITFDCMTAVPDTFIYQIAAVGIDGWEGPPVVAEPFVNTSVVTREKAAAVSLPEEVNLDWRDMHAVGDVMYYYSSVHEAGVGWHCRIIKYAPDFVVEKEAELKGFKAGQDLNVNHMYHDGAGNIYVMTFDDQTSLFHLYRFDQDLNRIADRTISYRFNLETTFAVSMNGATIVYERNSLDYSSTRVTVFDTDLTIVSEDSVQGCKRIVDVTTVNDTVVALIEERDSSRGAGVMMVECFDAYFNKLSSRVIDVESFLPHTIENPSVTLRICSGRRLVVWRSPYSDLHIPPEQNTVMYFVDHNSSVIARYIYPGSQDEPGIFATRFYNDGAGSFYEVAKDSIVRYRTGGVIAE